MSVQALRGLSALAALALAWSPEVALACPMCIGADNQNADAFLWGSLFLMFVPVAAIGSLLYWAYRRTRALERPPFRPAPALDGDADAAQPGLRVVRR